MVRESALAEELHDNALAETVIGLHKTEVIRRRGPWRNIDEANEPRRGLFQRPAAWERLSAWGS